MISIPVQKAVSYVLTAAVVALLVLAWLITAPFVRRGGAMSRRHRSNPEDRHPLHPRWGTRLPK